MPGFDREVLGGELERGITALALDADTIPTRRLLDYLELLAHWNRAYNLTAVRDPSSMVAYHLLDSLSLLPYLKGRRCLDIGTGAGLPGLVLALACPDQHWMLLDSNNKKTRFLEHVKMQLGLDNVEVVHDRIDAYVPAVLFDIVTARALSSLDQLCRWARSLLVPGGRLLAMKAKPEADEFSTIADRGCRYERHELTVPGIDGQRLLVECRLAS